MKPQRKIIKIFETKNICKKVYFGTKEAAEFHIIKRATEEDAKTARSYLCHKCNCWHITSWTAPDVEGVIAEMNAHIDTINADAEEWYLEHEDLVIELMNKIRELERELKKLRK